MPPTVQQTDNAERPVDVGTPVRAWEQSHEELLNPQPTHRPAVQRSEVRRLQGERVRLTGKPEEDPTHYVVLGDVDGIGEGRVLEAGQFPAGTDFQRLLDLGAVRPAEEGERGQQKVAATRPGANRSLDAVMAEKEKQIQSLQADLMQARNEVRALQSREQAGSGGGQVGIPAEKVEQLVREKDEAFRSLQAQYDEKCRECDSLKDQIAQAQAQHQQHAEQPAAEEDPGERGGRRRKG